MAAILREHGFDPGPGLIRAGLDGDFLKNSPQTVTSREEYAYQRFFAAETEGRPDLWFELGLRTGPASLGPPGLAFLTAPTLRKLVRSIDQDPDNHFSLTTYHRLERGSGLDGFEIRSSDCPDELKAFTIHREVATAIACFNILWVGSFPFASIEVELVQPDEIHPWTKLGIRPVFGASSTKIMWHSDLSEQPLANGDEVLHAYYLAQSKAQIRYRTSTEITEQIKALLRGPKADFSIKGCAQVLGVSVRSLQRKIGEDGLCFKDLVMKVRDERAKDMLKQHKLPIEVIAAELGYIDRSSFDQAFRRINGLTPVAFRHLTSKR
jgi:AraC-like DNA-binding protein